jgi:hypothetical protein
MSKAISQNQAYFLMESLEARRNNNQLFLNTTNHELAWENPNQHIIFVLVYNRKGHPVHSTRLYSGHVICVPPYGLVEQLETL